MSSSKVFLYLNDIFIKIPCSLSDILEAWDEDKLKPFELIRDIIESELGDVVDVRLYDVYLNFEKMILVLDYMVDFQSPQAKGTQCVKIIYAGDPRSALMEYYEVKRRGRRDSDS
ncbi:MAG: hypothetical protein DRJ63_04705 [Thermoprotei archaeon]|nr:MAG: hypothetical protein DRJ63_04705 [Thermoprotei archaeon]